MNINTADDVQLLVEDMGCVGMDINDIVEILERINQQELKAARTLVNQRVWDETFDDEMAAQARWHYMQKHQHSVTPSGHGRNEKPNDKFHHLRAR